MLGMGPAAALAVVLAVALPSADAAVARCPAAKLTVIVDGKRSCKARSAGRAIRPTSSFTAQIAGGLLGDPLIASPRPRLDDGRRLPPAISPALAAAARRGFARGEAAALAAAEELAKPPARRRVAAFAEPLAAPATTVSKPAVSGSITIDPKTGSGRATMGFEMTAKSGKESVTLGADLEIGVTAGEAGTLGARLRTTTDDGSGLRKTSMGGATITMSQGALCPDATGRIVWKNTTGTTNTSTMRQRVGPINAGNVATTMTTKTRIVATGQMSADAVLESISYTVVVESDYAHSGQVLAFFGARARARGTGTATGRLDPKSGQPLAGASVRITTSATGDEPAKTRAYVAAQVEKALREVLGDIQKQLKEAEQRARAGECTTIDLSPSSPATLEAGASNPVLAQLFLRSGGRVSKVRWTATAGKGTIAPGTSDQTEGRFTATGAAPGPDTARVTFRAVSPAGISEAEWIGREELPDVLIATLAGKQTASGGSLIYTWNGTARLVRKPEQSTPNEIRWAVDSLTIGSYTVTIIADGCTGTATYSGVPATIGGGLDLVYGPDGSRGYRMNIGWTATDTPTMSWTGKDCPGSTPFVGVAASALTNGPLEIPAVTTRPFSSFTFDDSFTAADPGWTYETTAHVAPGQ